VKAFASSFVLTSLLFSAAASAQTPSTFGSQGFSKKLACPTCEEPGQHPPTPERPRFVQIPSAVTAARRVSKRAAYVAETLALAAREFRRNRIRFEDGLGYVGESDEPLEADAFYTAVEQPDLAASYRHRKTFQRLTAATAGVLAAAGVGFLFVGLTSGAQCQPGNCQTPIMPVIGGALIVLGAGAGVGASFIEPHPVDSQERKQLTTQHNAALRRKLGLDE